jgi:hypothetical protein
VQVLFGDDNGSSSRSFVTRKASSGGIHPASDFEPEAVCRSLVS